MHMSGQVARVRLCWSPPPRTKWTRRVPHSVLIGHALCWWTCGEMGADGRINGRARAPSTAGRRALSSDRSGWQGPACRHWCSGTALSRYGGRAGLRADEEAHGFN